MNGSGSAVLVFAGLPAWAVGVVGAVGAAAIIALYLLPRRRVRVVVPFLQLWVAPSSVSRRRGLSTRLRRFVSLALQLAIFALLLVAAADPRMVRAGAAGGGRTVVVLIDRSASMQATDEPGSRLGRAKEIARSVVDGLGGDDRAIVASFAQTVSTGTGIEDDRPRLLAAIDAVTAGEEAGDQPAALAFAGKMLAGRPRPTLILITDGGGTGDGDRDRENGDHDHDHDPAAGLRGVDVRVVPVGRRRDNLAIVAFSARRLADDPSTAELSLAVQSFRATASDVSLVIVAGPQRISVARRRLHLMPGGRWAATLPVTATPDPRLEAVIENARDDLPLDDRAFAVVPDPVRLRVLVVGARNLFLEGALLSLAATVEVDRTAPDAAEDTRARWSRYDAVIFDGVTPNPAPEAGHFLYLDPHGAGSPWRERGQVADPVVTEVQRDHPLVTHIGLMDLNVASARRLTLARGDVTVVSTLDSPLIVARTRPALREIAVAFDPRRSDLPLRSAFPLLLANALPWLANRQAAEAHSWPTGRTVRVDVRDIVAPRERSVTIVAPDGTRARAPVVSGAVSVALDQTGFFDVLADGRGATVRVAANLASTAESDLAPRTMPRIGGGVPPPPSPSPSPSSSSSSSSSSIPGGTHAPSDRANWLVLAAALGLVLCLTEWLTYSRRLTA